MRNVLTRAVSAFALAMVLAGSASAAGMTPYDHRQPVVSNPALQSQLDRDASPSEAWLSQSPLGQVIAPGSAAQSADGSDRMTAERDGHMHLSRDN